MTTLYITELRELASTEESNGAPLGVLPGTKNSTLSTAVAPVGIPNQTAPATANSGGTIANGTYYTKITAITANGESAASNEQNIVAAGTNISTITQNWGAVTGATGYKIYVGTAAGAENLVATVGAVTTNTLTALPGTAGTPPTTTNTAASITLQPDTRFVILGTDAGPCSVKVGPNADAAQTDTRLAPNVTGFIVRVDQPASLPSAGVSYSNALSVGNQVLQPGGQTQSVPYKLSTVLNT
jgi:hypothetical protein